jgi:hypothetical protein
MSDEPPRDEPEEDPAAVGPRENTDPATKADAGLPGSPAETYSPAGMGDEDRVPNEE